MRRYESAVMSLVLLPALALGLDLPQAPAGFSWHEVPAVRAAFLVPDGWHYQEEVQGRTLAIFITQENLASAGMFETGVTINIFIDNPGAAGQVKTILETTAASHSADVSYAKFGPFVKLACEFESPRDEGLEPVLIFLIGIVNTDTGTSYVISFESPKSAWPETWLKGKAVLDALMLESEA